MPLSYLRKRFQISKSVFPWKPNNYGAQDFVPVESKLNSRLGISKGSKVHVFAGYYGNWAHALAESTKVRYTDASKEFTEIAKKRGMGSVSYKTIAAELAPVRKNIFDWSFSFEPFPLIGHKGINAVASRALLNKKGLKVLYSERENERGKTLTEAISFVGNVYGAKMVTKKVRLNALKTSEKLSKEITFPRMQEFTLVTLLTNPLAREKVALDLKVQNFLDKLIKSNNPRGYNNPIIPLMTQKKLASVKRTQSKDFEFAHKMAPIIASKLGITLREVKESLSRLEELSKLYAKLG